MKTLFALAFLLLLPVVGQAQTVVVGAPKLAWDQAAPTLIDAQSYTYKAYVSPGGDQVLIGVTCSGGTSPFICQAQMLPIVGANGVAGALGTYTMNLTAALNGEESAPSNTITVQVVAAPVAPAVPAGLRVVTP